MPARAQQLLSEPLLGPIGESDIAILREAEHVLAGQDAPALKQNVLGHLARLANHFSTDRSPAEWKMLFEDYWEDLAEFSDLDVHQALLDHRRGNKWFPKIAQLRKLCEESRTIRRINRERLARFFGTR